MFGPFKHKKVFLPVVHVEYGEQAQRNIDIAFDAGADGVFLINHAISDDLLLQIASDVREDGRWIGVNCLGLSPEEVLADHHYSGEGVWTDSALPADYYDEDYILAMKQLVHSYYGLLFGGVAFKYQPQPKDIAEQCRQALRFVNVITTSGPATGKAPDLDKIKTMREIIGDHDLAIASGIDVENVEAFLPYVDCFLVASSIGKSFTDLDPTKVKALADKIHG